MNYLEFEKALRPFAIFSLKDIRKNFPDFDNRRLVEWQNKGYIKKIKRGYYCFAEAEKSESFLYYTANRIYSPSYISLETALYYYGIIPEAVFRVTSVSTRNTVSYETPVGAFEYRNMKPLLFFGYRLTGMDGFSVKMAEPEKLILDYFYYKKTNDPEDVRELRLNEAILKELIDTGKLRKYQKVFQSQALNKRVEILLNMVYA